MHRPALLLSPTGARVPRGQRGMRRLGFREKGITNNCNIYSPTTLSHKKCIYICLKFLPRVRTQVWNDPAGRFKTNINTRVRLVTRWPFGDDEVYEDESPHSQHAAHGQDPWRALFLSRAVNLSASRESMERSSTPSFVLLFVFFATRPPLQISLWQAAVKTVILLVWAVCACARVHVRVCACRWVLNCHWMFMAMILQ